MATIITILFVLAYQLFTIWHCRTIKLKVKDLAIGGMICALTIILDSIAIPLPTGAKINPGAMIPIMLLAIVYDEKLAMIVGWITGLLVLFLLPGWQPVHWAQIFVEHLICFSCLGYAGIFKSDKKVKLFLGMVIAIAISMFAHVFAGVVFFSEYAPEGTSPFVYSLVYNFSSMIPEAIGTIIIMLLLPIKNIKKALSSVINR